MTNDDYPVRFDVDYPEKLDQLTTAFRIVMIIPIAIVLATVSGAPFASENVGEGTQAGGAAAGGLLILGPLLMILFRQKYPRWWFDWNLELLRFTARVESYFFLLTDAYPSTDEEQAVRLDIDYPDVDGDLNRWLPLVKWLLAIPHVVVLVFLWLAALVSVFIAWFAILFTGRYPKGLFDFVVGVMRWTWRTVAYAMVLTTDRYPPFRLA
jgi:hypothetical protein